MTQQSIKKSGVSHIQIEQEHAGRRIDNYLFGYLGNIPKTRIYKMLRKGEVRVNGSRIKQDYRLINGDVVRLPPLYQSTIEKLHVPHPDLLEKIRRCVIYEDTFVLVLNKPSGIAVHSGENEPFGVIELLRHLRPGDGQLELVHRLDKPTSGCLLVARDHRILRAFHDQLRENRVEKQYLAVLNGKLPVSREVTAALYVNKQQKNEKKVIVDPRGKHAWSHFSPCQCNDLATLSRVQIKTGKTHQIRVHAASINHPVAGDTKYGDKVFNRVMREMGLKRMFLHAEQLNIRLPHTDKFRRFIAPLPDDLNEIVNNIFNNEQAD